LWVACLDGIEEADELLLPMGCMLRPMTVPSGGDIVEFGELR
jgi:hypothetical protein